MLQFRGALQHPVIRITETELEKKLNAINENLLFLLNKKKIKFFVRQLTPC